MRAVLLAALLVPLAVSAGQEDRTIGPAERSAVVDSIARAVQENYVFPGLGARLAGKIREKHRAGEYAGWTSLFDFAQQLTADLREECGDGHLAVRFRPDEYFQAMEDDTITEEERGKEAAEEAYENFGFLRAERLPGNVGYIRMNGFYDARRAGPTAAAAAAFIGHCDAVVLDLRLTLGGSPTMDQLLAGYFFDEPTELSAFHRRRGDSTDVKQFWSPPFSTGADLSEADLYILTSEQTPSAAEAFAYDMKHLGRATVVGDTTAGAAHPSGTFSFPDLNLEVSVPFGRPVHPVTGTDWEGVGVFPDVPVDPEKALDVAHVLALEKLEKRAVDPKRRTKVSWALTWVKGWSDPAPLTSDDLAEYQGSYGTRTFWVEGSELRYRRGTGKTLRLAPIGEDVFLLEDLYYVRFRFMRDEEGKVGEVVSLSEEGPTSRYAKDR